MYDEVRISAGIPKKPLHETMKGKLRLQWGPQHVGETRIMSYPPREASCMKWSGFKRLCGRQES